MPVLLLVIALATVAYLWWRWRTTTLTRDCRWRLDRARGENCWHCASCGAEMTLAGGEVPKKCLRGTG